MRAMVTSVVASLGVLAVGWQLGAAHEAQLSSQSTAVPASGTTSGTPTTESPTTPSATPDATYAGSSINTRFGPVQVQITVSGGTITDVTALQLTNADGRSVQISNRAAPVLRSEVLAAQSAQVSNVSGATYTTQGYLKSLQSALDQAGL